MEKMIMSANALTAKDLNAIMTYIQSSINAEQQAKKDAVELTVEGSYQAAQFTVNAAEDQAESIRDQAYGTFAEAGGQVLGAGAQAALPYFSQNSEEYQTLKDNEANTTAFNKALRTPASGQSAAGLSSGAPQGVPLRGKSQIDEGLNTLKKADPTKRLEENGSIIKEANQLAYEADSADALSPEQRDSYNELLDRAERAKQHAEKKIISQDETTRAKAQMCTLLAQAIGSSIKGVFMTMSADKSKDQGADEAQKIRWQAAADSFKEASGSVSDTVRMEKDTLEACLRAQSAIITAGAA